MDTGTNGTVGTQDRNTKNRSWVFTWNNYPPDFKEKLALKFADCEEYHYQEEVGTNGTPHLQGCMRWKNARSFSAVRKLLENNHVEPCHNWHGSKNYCTKTDTRAGIVVSTAPGKRAPCRDPLIGKTLYPWEIDLLEMIKGSAENRYIRWIVDVEGGRGKTTFCKSLCIQRPGQVLYLSGKASDMKYGVKAFLENEKNDLRVVLLDFTRTVENFVSYQGIEEIKNGFFFNTKYESEMIVIEQPHVICFSNFYPDTNAMSKGRWQITTLD